MAKAIQSKALDRLEVQAGKLLATQKLKAQATDYSRYAKDPLGFARDILHMEPWQTKQIEIFLAIKDHTQVTVKGCNGAGKDAASGAIALWWAYAVGGRVVIMAPTQRQVDEIIFGSEIKQHFERSNLPGELFQRKLEPEGVGPWAEIIGFVSKDVSNLTGFHAPHVLFILTEAQGVEDAAWEAMFATALDEDDRFLAVGNPLEPVGRFYATFAAGSAWHQITISAFDHPNVVQGRVVIPGGPTRASLERAKREEGGEGSRYWISRILAQFPDTTTDSLITKEWWDEAVKKYGSAFMAKANGQPLVIALDVARSGGDLCVATVLQGPCVREMESWHPDPSNPTESTVDHAEKIALRWGMRKADHTERNPLGAEEVDLGTTPGLFIVDVALMGGGIADGLKTRGWTVIEFNGARAATEAEEPSRYENLRAWGYWTLRTAFQRGQIAVVPLQPLLEELLATRYQASSGERTQIVKKSLIRVSLGRSPDHADSLMMGWTMVTQEGATIGGETGNMGF